MREKDQNFLAKKNETKQLRIPIYKHYPETPLMKDQNFAVQNERKIKTFIK
jgi:hypothetical protein